MVRNIAPSIRTLDIRVAPQAPKKADAELLTPEHRAWRQTTLDRAGWRCEWTDDRGHRCIRSRATGDRMIADHIVERKDGGSALDPRNGQCLCTQHNTLKGIAARKARIDAPF